jgi:hypothetical protein
MGPPAGKRGTPDEGSDAEAPRFGAAASPSTSVEQAMRGECRPAMVERAAGVWTRSRSCRANQEGPQRGLGKSRRRCDPRGSVERWEARCSSERRVSIAAGDPAPLGVSRRKRQEGSEIVVTRSGCRRGESLRRVAASRVRPRGPMRCSGTEHVPADRNVANPRSGTELQYARSPTSERTVEVVGNHGGGAWGAVWQPLSRRCERFGAHTRTGALMSGERRRGERNPGRSGKVWRVPPPLSRARGGDPVDSTPRSSR